MIVLLLSIYNHGHFDHCEEIGVCYLASYLRAKGHRVTLIGKHFEEVDFSQIIRMRPDIVGMNMYDETKSDVIKSSRIIKEALPDSLIIVGGNTPTYYGKELLREFPDLDIAVKGEGEQILYEIAECVKSKRDYTDVKGIIFKDNSGMVMENDPHHLISDINIVPWQSRELLMDKQLPVAQILSSRGCCANCSFCASRLFWGKWRGRSIDNVLDEMEFIYCKHNIRIFNFNDCSMEDPDSNCDRLKSLASGIIKRRLNIVYYGHFRAEFHRKADTEAMELLNESGLGAVCIGFESGNSFDLKLYNKIADFIDMETVEKLFLRYDINIEPGFINFNPYSTTGKLRENADFLKRMECCRNDIENITTRYRMYKGTILYNSVAHDNLLKEQLKKGIDYEFQNKSISHLYNYLDSYVFKSENRNSFSKLLFFSRRFYSILLYYKKIFIRYGAKSETQFINLLLSQYKEIYHIFSEKMFLWYFSLINLADAGWNNEMADGISRRYFNAEEIHKTSKELTFILSSLKIMLKKTNDKSIFIDLI